MIQPKKLPYISGHYKRTTDICIVVKNFHIISLICQFQWHKRGGYKRQKKKEVSLVLFKYFTRGGRRGPIWGWRREGKVGQMGLLLLPLLPSPTLFSTSSPPLLTPSYFHSPLTHIVCSLQSRRGTHVERWLRLRAQCLGINILRILHSLYIRRISNFNGVNGEDNNVWSSHVQVQTTVKCVWPLCRHIQIQKGRGRLKNSFTTLRQ